MKRFEYIYKESVITRQKAVVQNEAILIAAEYAGAMRDFMMLNCLAWEASLTVIQQ